MNIKLKLFFGWLRLLHGFCPACNSDAPEIDRCFVCMRFRDWPPTKVLKAKWWRRFKRRVKDGRL